MNDINSISARIKNIIARQDIALSPVGKILVNYFTLMFKDLYDFSETLQELDKSKLNYLLEQKESLPCQIIQVASPKEQYMSVNDEINEKFKTTKEALAFYTQMYEDLGGDEFWAFAESSSVLTEDMMKVMRARRCIGMCRYLLEKEKT